MTKFFPTRRGILYRRPTVRVTAQWGWAAVPAAIKQATKIAAAKSFAMSGSPFGYVSYQEAGVVRVRDIPEVMNLLDPFLQDKYATA